MSFFQSVADLVAPWLCLQPSQMWPISSQSAPFLISMWLCLITALITVVFNKSKNSALERAKKLRYDTKMKTLKNLIFMEEARLAKDNVASEDDTNKKDLDIDNVKCEEKPPTAQFIYDVLFEKVEGEPIDRVIGIPKNDPWYLRAVLFLRKRVTEEVTEAVKHTSQAQSLFVSADTNITKEQQIILDHHDGEKLAKILEFVKEKFLKDFLKQYGKEVQTPKPGVVEGVSLHNFDAEYLNTDLVEMMLFDDDVLIEGEKVLSQVRASQRNAIFFIMDILRPVLPTYGLAILFMFLARAFEAPLWAHSLPSFKASIGMINPNATNGQFGFGPDVLDTAKGHAILFIVGFLFALPIEMLAYSFEERATKEFSGPLRTAVMGAIMKQDTEYFDFNTSATLQERLNRDTRDLVFNMLKLPLKAMAAIFRVIQRMATLYFIAPAMLWSCLCFNVPVSVIIVFITKRLLKRLYGQLDRSRENVKTDTLEVLQKLHTVRQFSMESEEIEKYTVNNTTYTLFESRLQVITWVIHQIRWTSNIIGHVYVTYVALLLAIDGKATIIDAVVASTVGVWLQGNVNTVLGLLPEFLKMTKPIHRISSLLASTPRIEQEPSKPDKKLIRPGRFQGYIEFRNVTFSYPKERQKTVLNGFSFSAKPGQKIALVGKAGCGKSTCMQLLQRFYDRTGGDILIDNNPIEKYDVNILRKHSGIVAQTNVLFNRSIYENIVYGMEKPPSPESEEFKEVCDQAQAWDFIQQFPNKQYTVLGEDGVKLSGGQQQRIAIARVIIRQPTFLFLDEATSSLDAINEKAVQQAMDKMLRKFNGVAIVVAHRLTTICNCDNIIVMRDNGTKVEEGTHEELLKVPKQVDENGKPAVGPGLYHTLWDTQQAEGKDDGNAELKSLVERLEAQIKLQEKEIKEMKMKIYPSYPKLHRHLSAPTGY